MARYLLATLPVPGHVAPMAEVSRALVVRGHEVVWYGSSFFERQIGETGARFVPVKSTLDYGDSEYDKHFPDRHRYKGLAQIKFDFKHIFIDAIAGYLTDLREILRDFPADVLLADPAVAAARILGDQTGMPWAILNISVLGLVGRDVAPFGLGILPSYSPLGHARNWLLNFLGEKIIFRDVQSYYDAQARANGWPHFIFRPSPSPWLYLQPSIPSFEYPRSDLVPQLHFIGPLIPEAPSTFVAPEWWSDVTEARQPIVLVTQGTIATGAEQLIVPTLRALADEQVLVVATTGGKTAQELGIDVPANARIAPFIPFAKLMPHVSAMVTNGGYGGVMIALANGVPLVSGGTTEDKPEVSNRIAYSGVGINLKTATPTADQVKAAVRRVLAEPSFRQRAKHMQAELATYDGPSLAAKLLEQLATTRKPVYATLPNELRAGGWQLAPA